MKKKYSSRLRLFFVLQNCKIISHPVDFVLIIIAIVKHLWADIHVASNWSAALIQLAVTGISNDIQTLTQAQQTTK